MENTAKLSTSKDVIAYLVEKFPACFTVEGEPRPLKIGIFEDLAARLADDERVSKTRLRSALRQYTGAWRYLRCVTEGAQRVDLDGADAGLIEAEHAEHALQQLQESQARAKEQRQARAAESKAAAAKARAEANKGAQDKVRVDNKPRKASAANKPKAVNTRKTKTYGSGKKSPEQTAPDAKKPLEAVVQDTVAVGQQVQVKVGSFPVTGTITDLDKNDAQVQLPTGMVVRIARTELFRA